MPFFKLEFIYFIFILMIITNEIVVLCVGIDTNDVICDISTYWYSSLVVIQCANNLDKFVDQELVILGYY